VRVWQFPAVAPDRARPRDIRYKGGGGI
jgi:hypothetical protein